jgi:hypothetical protein
MGTSVSMYPVPVSTTTSFIMALFIFIPPGLPHNLFNVRQSDYISHAPLKDSTYKFPAFTLDTASPYATILLIHAC